MPSVPSTQSFYLRTPDGHRLHVQQHGPAGGEPWLVLHGGPGSGCQPGMAAWFDPMRHRAIMPDQRGAGRSTPSGTLRRNTVGALLADLEQLRRTLGIERWGVVGGSWGATLALAYAARYPRAVAALVLRGTFLTARADVDRLFLPRGGGRDMLRRVTSQGERLPDARAHLLTVSRVLHRGTTVQKWDTAAAWRRTERGLLGLGATAPAARQPWREQAAIAGKYRIQAHYLRRRAGLGKPAMLAAGRAIAQQGIPVTIVHGRGDAVCSPVNAVRLHAVMPEARMVWVDGGHLATGATQDALSAAIREARWRG